MIWHYPTLKDDGWYPSKDRAWPVSGAYHILQMKSTPNSLYVYREYANGNKAMARPCPACMKYIKEFGIKHICYSTADGIAEERID